ncbi:MAG UNVERIFIED_CONTAM: hypothetical protein LVQ98_05945 [Rickettsiaceae bacterium]
MGQKIFTNPDGKHLIIIDRITNHAELMRQSVKTQIQYHKVGSHDEDYDNTAMTKALFDLNQKYRAAISTTEPEDFTFCTMYNPDDFSDGSLMGDDIA